MCIRDSIKGIITDVHHGSVDVKVVAKHNVTTDVWSVADYEEGSSTNSFQGYDIGIYNEQFTKSASENQPNRYQIFNNSGVSQRIERTRFQAAIGIGSTEINFGDDLSGLKVAPGDQIKSLNGTYTADVVDVPGGGTQRIIMNAAATVAFANTDFIVMSGVGSGLYLREGNMVHDWYNQQTLGLTNTEIYWNQIAEAPTTTEYAKQRNAKYDEFHVLVVDDTGSVTGTAGAIIEKLSLIHI